MDSRRKKDKNFALLTAEVGFNDEKAMTVGEIHCFWFFIEQRRL